MRGTQFAELITFVAATKSSTVGIVADDAEAQLINLATPGSSSPRPTGLAISGRPFPPGAGRTHIILMPRIEHADQRKRGRAVVTTAY
jgi:hypothetical protein